MPDFEQKPYCPDHPFKADGNLIYLLQNSGKPPYDMYNDITIRVDQFPGGVNKMPREVMQRLITHLHTAANAFIWEECGI